MNDERLPARGGARVLNDDELTPRTLAPPRDARLGSSCTVEEAHP